MKEENAAQVKKRRKQLGEKKINLPNNTYHLSRCVVSLCNTLKVFLW